MKKIEIIAVYEVPKEVQNIPRLTNTPWPAKFARATVLVDGKVVREYWNFKSKNSEELSEEYVISLAHCFVAGMTFGMNASEYEFSYSKKTPTSPTVESPGSAPVARLPEELFKKTVDEPEQNSQG